VQRFRIPDLLNKLISEGVWPNEKWSTAQFHRQEIDPIIGKEGTQKVSPDNDKIILMPSPFHTIADEVNPSNLFWVHLTNYGEIDYSKAVIIADFGLGSDSPIILYYDDSESAKVMYLKWSFSGSGIQHSWVCTHSSFEEFANDTGLLDRLNE
jgi:hypothetical protein